jgi:signal transduction histidine kinase
MLDRRRLQKSTIILSIIIVSSIVLSLFSYNYFTQTNDKIQSLAIRELQTNSEIEAFSLSNGLGNAINTIRSNLELIANSPSTTDWNISKIQILLNKGLESTASLTDGYYLLDKEGKIVTFTSIDEKDNSKYVGTDLSSREYFNIPKQNGTIYISTVIISNDNIPRLYISVPIFSSFAPQVTNVDNRTNGNESLSISKTFEGVVFASIETKMLGRFLEDQIHPNFPGDVTFVDRNGTILYTQNQTLIGEGIFGQKFQRAVNLLLKDRSAEFNSIIRNAMNSNNGMNEFTFGNNVTTIAYDSVTAGGKKVLESSDKIGTLFIAAPHTLAEDVTATINFQTSLTFIIIGTIITISFITAILLLKWNRLLGSLVNQKTGELKEMVKELSQSNSDLTKTKNALTNTNQELAISNSKLKDANKALEQHDIQQKEFINIAAHELRTPSQAISGNIELIEIAYLPSLLKGTSANYEKIDKEFEDMVKDKQQLHGFIEGLMSTYRNSRRLEKIVSDILDVSRIEGKRLELDKEIFNINEKVKNVIRDIHEESSETSKAGNVKPVDIRFETEQDPLMVLIDRTRMFQAISNLINNAIKFSDNGPITISIKKDLFDSTRIEKKSDIVTTKNQNDKSQANGVIVSIKDKGKGIDEEILPQLFNKFVTKSEKGTGLGLYIAKRIIEAHGGEIWAQNNQDGKGATFTFRLPLQDS